MAFNPDPKPIKEEKTKMSAFEFQRKYGRKKTLQPKPRKLIKRKSKTARQKAKDAFQKYVRFRDSDKDGLCRCITCGKVTVWNKNTDGGHFRPAHLEATCFDDRNVNAQCKICNLSRMQQTELLRTYESNIDSKWGKGTAKELHIKSLIPTKRNSLEYKEIEKFNKKRLKELQNKRLSS